MRKYQPAWLKLKQKGSLSILTPKHLHARVIKAILKERTMDTGFRYELSEANKCAKVFAKSDGNIITFKLKYYLSPEDI